jgi:hypothetical protein
MRVLLAAYDPAHNTLNGDYWACSHADLPGDLRTKFYYEVAVGQMPAESSLPAS